MTDRTAIAAQADRLATIKGMIEGLNAEKADLEGYFLKLAVEDLENTKYKTVSYSGTDANRIIVTVATSVKVIEPFIKDLKSFFGSSFTSQVIERLEYKLAADPARMVAGLLTGQIMELTVADVIKQIPGDPVTHKALTKKVKGLDFHKDMKNIMAIAGLSEQDATMYAYFAKEAYAYERFQEHKACELIQDEEVGRYMELLKRAVIVDETPKVKVVTDDDA